MATIFGILEIERFIQFREDYFLQLRNYSDSCNGNINNIKPKIQKFLDQEFSNIKAFVFSAIENIFPEKGEEILRHLQYQASQSNINDPSIFCLKYRDHFRIHKLSTQRDLISLTERDIEVCLAFFELYSAKYNEIIKFLDEIYFQYQRGDFAINKEVFFKDYYKCLIKKNPTIVIDESFSLLKYKPKADKFLTKFNVDALTILFYHLREKGVTVNFSDDSFGKILSYVIGQSHRAIRDSLKDYEVLKENTVNGNIYNLNRKKEDILEVISLLQDIIDDLNGVLNQKK